MNDKGKDSSVDWFDRLSKLTIPVAGALLVALAAFFGDQYLGEFSSRQENARLITQLQIQREQAEIDLRKDVFNQALAALLVEEEPEGPNISKRMLKLELLAHNFGDSLNLAPIFSEFNRDLDLLEVGPNSLHESLRVADARERLRRLARRLTSKQLSDLAQHGAEFDVIIPLPVGEDVEFTQYNWPEQLVCERVGNPEDYADDAVVEDWDCLSYARNRRSYQKLPAVFEEYFDGELRSVALRQHAGSYYFLSVTVDDLKLDDQSVRVSFAICANANAEAAIEHCNSKAQKRSFRLDTFNFPKIDNTRLGESQRFAIVLDNIDSKKDSLNPNLFLSAVVFPSERASLREPPSMEEAVTLLHSVLKSQEVKADDD